MRGNLEGFCLTFIIYLSSEACVLIAQTCSTAQLVCDDLNTAETTLSTKLYSLHPTV